MVIFATVNVNHEITNLSTLKVSQSLGKLCPGCIVEKRFNRRLDVIGVDTRNSQTTLELLRCTDSLPRSSIFGLILDVDSTTSGDDISTVRRLGTS